MNILEKICYFFEAEMTEPKAFGDFHIFCLILTGLVLFGLYLRRNKYCERQLKIVIGTYSIVTLILEILKQLVYSFNYDTVTNIVTWDYPWYSFPFQLCTTPMYVLLICLFLKKCKLRQWLFSYISFITIWGSIMTVLMPDSCFVSTIIVNIHTTWLHYGSLVMSFYLLIVKEVKLDKTYLKNAIITFLVFVAIANTLNIVLYNSNILNGETFNMFYISPYFESSLAVFVDIQKNVPYLIFLFIYIFALSLGGFFIYGIGKIGELITMKSKISFRKKAYKYKDV